VPFLVAESNTAKINGLLTELGLKPEQVLLSKAAYPVANKMAQNLIGHNKEGRIPVARLAMLRQRAKRNFSWCLSESCPDPQAPVQTEVGNPVMLRAYHDGHKGATAFFRNRPFLETFFSELLRSKQEGPIKILVHACSVGAEVWSLALWWLHKTQPACATVTSLDIAATDIDPNFLDYAQQGIYPKSLLVGMTQDEQSWLVQQEQTFCVPDAARKIVRFLPAMNFISEAPEECFDAVLAMNTLTYVSPDEQTLALRTLSGRAKHLLGVTAFHPDSIANDLSALGFQPCMQAHQRIHEAWGDRLSPTKIAPDHPDYSWRLPPYEALSNDYAFRYGSLFVRTTKTECNPFPS